MTKTTITRVLMAILAIGTFMPLCAQNEQVTSTTADAKEQTLWNDKKNQIYLSIGGITRNAWSTALDDIFIQDVKHDNNMPTFTIGYQRVVLSHLSVGMDVTYEHEGVTEKKTNAESTHHYLSFMPSVRYYWFRSDNIAMYTKASYGLCVISNDWGNVDTKADRKDTDYRQAFQISPVAIEFGGQLIRGFAEVGLGDQGTIQAGVRYAF